MNQPWSQAIARLAKAKANNIHLLNDAQSELQAAHSSIRKQSQQSEKALKQLEADYSSAKEELDALASEMTLAEKRVEPPRGSDFNAMKAALKASEARVDNIEQSLLELKGVVSHNRYRLFQLSQQLDTLCATSQLHKAHRSRSRTNGVVTALDALALVSQQQACNDD